MFSIDYVNDLIMKVCHNKVTIELERRLELLTTVHGTETTDLLILSRKQ